MDFASGAWRGGASQDNWNMEWTRESGQRISSSNGYRRAETSRCLHQIASTTENHTLLFNAPLSCRLSTAHARITKVSTAYCDQGHPSLGVSYIPTLIMPHYSSFPSTSIHPLLLTSSLMSILLRRISRSSRVSRIGSVFRRCSSVSLTSSTTVSTPHGKRGR